MQNLVESEQALTLAKSCNIDLPLTIKISRIEGNLSSFNQNLNFSIDQSNQNVSLPDLYISVQVWSDNRPLTLPLYTPHKHFTSSLTWSTPITLPIKYKDLPHSAQLTFNIFNVTSSNSNSPKNLKRRDPLIVTNDFLIDRSTIIGGTTLSLFGKKRTLRKGKQRCLIHRDRLADGSVSTTTPSKLSTSSDQDDDKLGKLEKLVKKHERGDLPRLEWLDQCTFRQIEKIHAQETSKSPYIFLYIDLPRFDFPIVYSECELPPPILPQHFSALPQQQLNNQQQQPQYATQSLSHLFTVVDPEMVNDNPIENKHTRLHRSHRNGPLDRELRPEKRVRDALNNILSYPPTRVLKRDERDLLWRFRFYLSHDKRALTKFLKSVVWSDKGEVRQAIEDLLPNWAEIGIDDALELLGPSEYFRDPRLKRFAVQQLTRAEDDELVLYLLQLVQGLKFDISSSFNSNESPTSKSSLGSHSARSRFSSVTSRAQVGMSENSNDLFSSDYRPHSRFFGTVNRSNELEENNRFKNLSLEDFLIERACLNPVVLGYQFYWYLTVEEGAGGDKGVCMMYGRILKKFYDKMQETEKGRVMADVIQRQRTFISSLSKLAYDIRTSKDTRPKKIEKLRQILKDPSKQASIFSADSIGSINPLPLPLDPTKLIVGIDGEKSTVFKSNLFPLRLILRCEDGSEYPIIAKNGDDLRQDQLVIQLINLMDRLLKKENLDLKLTPYKVLATSKDDGLVQLIKSKSLGEILSEYPGGILEYLRIENNTGNNQNNYQNSINNGNGDGNNFRNENNGNENEEDVSSEEILEEYGVKTRVMENFIRSCAGYCVVTYILGVGDRHLDNLLLSPDGHFFHVDFGYILGRDPKPLPPAIKLCKEMIEAMGGTHSRLYSKFKRLSFIGYLNLRKSNGLIINLVELMIDGNIPDIILEPDKAVMKVQEKFKLNLVEEDEVIKEFEKELNESSYFTLVFDKIHAFAQYWRS